MLTDCVILVNFSRTDEPGTGVFLCLLIRQKSYTDRGLQNYLLTHP